MLFGATFETKDRPSGEMKSSATVRKKYMTISTHGPAFMAACVAVSCARKSVEDG